MNELSVPRPSPMVRRQARMAGRGLVAAGLFATAILAGWLPIPAAFHPVLLGLTAMFAGTRLLRGMWAARVARHQFTGWRRRQWARTQGPAEAPAMVAPVPETADRRAVRVLTAGAQEPMVLRARVRGQHLADQLTELRGLLADGALSPPLRRPVAEALAHAESELESLLDAISAVLRADHRQRDDLLSELGARLEVEEGVPAGLYAVG